MLFVVLASAGCLGPTKSRGRAAGAITATAGTLLLIDGLTTDCGGADSLGEAIGCGLHQDTAPIFGGALIALGVIVLAVNELRTPAPEPAGPETAPGAPAAAPVAADPVPRPETDDPVLRQLTLQASVAARTGACSAVTTIASRIARLDPTYRQGAFQRDAKIAACLRG